MARADSKLCPLYACVCVCYNIARESERLPISL